MHPRFQGKIKQIMLGSFKLSAQISILRGTKESKLSKTNAREFSKAQMSWKKFLRDSWISLFHTMEHSTNMHRRTIHSQLQVSSKTTKSWEKYKLVMEYEGWLDNMRAQEVLREDLALFLCMWMPLTRLEWIKTIILNQSKENNYLNKKHTLWFTFLLQIIEQFNK